MIAGRPLLLLSLPSLAIIVGLVWYRRKFKPDAGDRGGEKSKECESAILSRGVSSTLAEHEPDMRQSSSLPIQQQAGGGGNGAENWDNCSGSGHSSAGSSRSAPIDIVPNKSPSKDDLLGRSHLLEHDNEELSFSPSIDLPGSVVSRYPQNLRKFNQMMEPTKEPVVIRPTKAASLQSGHFRVPDENGNANSATPVSPRSPKKQSPQPKPYAAATESDRLNGNCVPEPDAATIDDVFDPKPESFDERNEQTGSPPLSICSVRSEDSGKGSSPPHSVGPSVTTYEFLVPAFLVAGMLGKQGTFVKQIKQKTGANVIIKRNPDTHNSKICTLEGSQQEIQDALSVIRKKFPQKRFPGLTLQRIEISRVETVIPLSLMNDTCSSVSVCDCDSIRSPVIARSGRQVMPPAATGMTCCFTLPVPFLPFRTISAAAGGGNQQ